MAAAVATASFSDSLAGIWASYPSSWYFARRSLPDYVYPQQVFSLSNYPISIPPSLASVWDPTGDPDNVPRVAALPADAVFLWMYFFLKPDGPSYGAFAPPITMSQGRQSNPLLGDRRWPNLIQWEFGFVAGTKIFSMWVWRGGQVTPDTDLALQNLLSSIRTTP